MLPAKWAEGIKVGFSHSSSIFMIFAISLHHLYYLFSTFLDINKLIFSYINFISKGNVISTRKQKAGIPCPKCKVE